MTTFHSRNLSYNTENKTDFFLRHFRLRQETLVRSIVHYAKQATRDSQTGGGPKLDDDRGKHR
jgi:hypothetical protein